MITPRPWRIVEHDPSIFRGTFGAVVDAEDCAVFQIGRGVVHPDTETAQTIVALVNAQPEIVVALEASERVLSKWPAVFADELELVRSALAKIKGG